ncbi:MAG TPA: ATP-dependent zinc metalloprotease FtsH [Nitriliruptorales bacterium]|nr:ATP-dependent zinc metalloprotease FtsH [Nitriliruptorales bacterium]
MQRLFRGPFFWVLVLLVALWATVSFVQRSAGPQQVMYSEWTSAAREGRVETVEIRSEAHELVGSLRQDGDEVSYRTHYDPEVNATQIQRLIEEQDIREVTVDPQQTSALLNFLFSLLPFVLIFLLFFFLMQQMQGGGSRVMSFGKARARMVSKDQPKVTFADVAGVDEAVEELREIKEFLESPQKFQAMGAKIPKGVLLYGPPGTGKTLLARAVAGEAGVPFFSISGSDFVEMFVGVGASRVRDLFEQAKANAPAIIFMDEIDAVGRHRGAGLGGGHDEREQTLNQLLVEMDGFDMRSGVILIAATNRPDILDPALLRPGRFDRQIVVDRPDLVGRRAILKVHTRGKPLAPGVDVDVLARQTPGFTGADLANLVNEAALLAARFGKKEVSMDELEESIERVVAGPERRTRLMSDEEKRVVAYHEAGHAIVGHALPNADPVHKISIIPRGRALGFTLQLPTEDRYLIARGALIDRLAVMLGGRVAEELKVGDITTGAGDDIQRATATAREMVTQYGMSDSLGPVVLGQKDHQPFLGRDLSTHQDYSDEVAYEIDQEVRKLVDEAHDEALEILVENESVLEATASRLLEVETVDSAELERLFDPIRKRPSRAVSAPADKSAAAVVQTLRRLDGSGNGQPRGDGARRGAGRRPSGARHPHRPSGGA